VSLTKGRLVAVCLLGALGAAGGVLLADLHTDESDPFDAVGLVDDAATVRCTGSVVQLDFDPAGRIEARLRSETVAAADVSRRGLNRGACAPAPTQRGWDTRVAYTPVRERTMVTCRFPGSFSVHVHPVSPSWSGERPAGSAVYLVLDERLGPGTGPDRTILASASVIERSEESQLVFAADYCTAS
jgi:hypothetical protein